MTEANGQEPAPNDTATTPPEDNSGAEQQPAEQPQETTPEVDPRITKANREAAKYRTERNDLQKRWEAAEQAQQERDQKWQKLMSALGADEEESPEDRLKAVQATADEKQAEADKVRQEFREYRLQQDVANTARKAGADGDLVRDILAGRGALSDLDPTADDYTSQVEQLVTQTVEQHPTLRAQKVPNSSGNAPTPQGETSKKLTREDLNNMTAEEINQAVREGKLAHLLNKEE